MISELTNAQKDRFPEFVKKWISIGLCTDSANRQEAERGVVEAYKAAGINPPKKIVWCGSPFSQALNRAIILGLKNLEIIIGESVRESVNESVRESVNESVKGSVSYEVWKSIRESVKESVEGSVSLSVSDGVWQSVWQSVNESVEGSVSDEVWQSVRESVWQSVGDEVWKSVWQSVNESVGDEVWKSITQSVKRSVGQSVRQSVSDEVWQSVSDEVWQSVNERVGQSVKGSVGQSVRQSVLQGVNERVLDWVRQGVWESVYGQHDASWLAFYEYFKEVCGLDEQTQKLCGLWLISKNAGWWIPHQNICWISERHNILNRNSKGQLHCENGIALAYPDGWGIYALNGVHMKPEHVLTPSERITPQQVLSETNVEVRRELLRKIGVERFLKVAKHKVLDKKGDYELLEIELHPETPKVRYLKMLNPSIGVWHVEKVNKECNTIQAAINWRASKVIEEGEIWNPAMLT